MPSTQSIVNFNKIRLNSTSYNMCICFGKHVLGPSVLNDSQDTAIVLSKSFALALDNQTYNSSATSFQTEMNTLLIISVYFKTLSNFIHF